MNENKNDEGWIALAVITLVVVGVWMILWTPDVEAIGSWIYERIN
jgi:type II secretory pathway component PulM